MAVSAAAPRDYRGMSGGQVARAIREDFGPQTMLSFSRGKDSIATWLSLRGAFEPADIIPYYLYIVPGLLSFERESLDYFENDVFGRKIITLPHPGLFRMLGNLILQPADRIAVLQAANLPAFDYHDVHAAVKQTEGINHRVMVASGLRAADSPQRRLSMLHNGPVSLANDQFYPVFDWNKHRLIEEISRSGIKLPEDYHLFGRSFDGLDMRFLLPLKRHKPADYRRVLEWFPFADLEIWMLEKRGVI